jgi:hypothetical protein
MLRVSRMAFIRVVLIATITTIVAACDQVKQAKTAAQLRSQIETALARMESGGEVPGLEHRHVTVDPASDVEGFAIKIYDVKLGTPGIGFQSFREMDFNLAQSGPSRFTAADFKLTPEPVANGPKQTADLLIERLKTAASAIQVKD